MFASCATLIKPPESVNDGKFVALLDHGRHSSLVLPVSSQEIARYSYGDWQYYALGKTGLLQGSSALLWPSQAALGRRVFKGAISIENIKNRIAVPIDEVFLICVESTRIRALVAYLEEIYRSNLDSLVYNSAYDLEFVHHPDSYWVFHNSNQVVASWLSKLDCQISGIALVAVWKLYPSTSCQQEQLSH